MIFNGGFDDEENFMVIFDGIQLMRLAILLGENFGERTRDTRPGYVKNHRKIIGKP